MARFAYDVNTRTRLIDVHKQFNGGLKTVDTDDALGSVYLRQAENVSLSEFGFIEKRYGTFEKNLIKSAGLTVDSKLQGYWEYNGFPIYVIDNKFYYNNASGESVPIESIGKETEDSDAPETIYGEDWRYPSNSDLPTYNSSGFDSTVYRDMNAVNINNVLYVFTGFYPVYIKTVTTVVNNENVTTPRIYWFSITIPSYDEIVVTGHNLLEHNYDNVYGYTTPNAYQTGSSTYNTGVSRPTILSGQSNYHPVIPFVKSEGSLGSLNLEFVTQFPTGTGVSMDSFSTSGSNPYWEIDIEKASYRPATTSSSIGSYTEIDSSEVTFQKKSNYSGSSDVPYVKETVSTTNLANESAARSTQTAVDSNNHTYTKVFYTMIVDFDVDKDTILNNKDFMMRLRRETSIPNVYNAFNLSNEAIDYTYTILGQTPGEGDIDVTIEATNEFYFALQALDEDGNLITYVNDDGLTVGLQLTQQPLTRSSNLFKFNIDDLNNGDGLTAMYRTTDVKSYRIQFYHQVMRPIAYSDPDPDPDLGSIKSELDLQFQLAGDKESAGSGNIITSNSIPPLRVSISELISGRYDFEVVFKRDRYELVSGVLQYDNTEYFTGYVFGVPISPEKLEDFPGQTADFLPKLKPIWTCNKVIEHYGKLMVWGSTEMPTALFYSFPDRPTYFPQKFYLDFSNDTNQPLEAVTPFMNILVVQTASQTWGVRGNSGIFDAPSPYAPFGINGTVGTIAYKSVRPVRNHLFFLSRQGVIALKSLYAADEQYNIDFVDRNIRNIVPQDSDAVGIQFDNQYWLNFPNNSITLRWYIDKKAWVKDVYQGWVDEKFKGVFKYQIREGKLEFITYPSIELEDETVYKIHKIGVDYDLPTDLTEGIKSKFETSFLNQNYPFHPKNYKEAKLDFTLQNEYNKSQGFIYEMDYDEDLDSTSIHTIEDAVIIPNHYYRIKYNFEPHEPPTLSGGTFDSQPTDSVEGGTMGAQNTDILTGILENDDYDSTFDHLTISNVAVRNYNNTVAVPVNNLTINTDTGEVTFQVPNFVADNKIDVEITGDFTNYTNGADITNITYDDALTLNAWVVSENQTLNLDNINNYDQAKADVDFNFNTRLGTWVFGSSDFGNKVTAVKTIKLSGKGYNAKIYIEDDSKSKWTLESMGLTYKMKRARSR